MPVLVPPLNALLAEWPTKLLTLLPPWWWMICHHSKRRENRSWSTSYRGWFWIHASGPQNTEGTMKIVDDIVRAVPLGRGRLKPTAAILNANAGHIVARARLVACEKNTPAICLRDPWAIENDYGFVIENLDVLDVAVPWKGAQGLVSVEPQDVATIAHIAGRGGVFVLGNNEATRLLGHYLEHDDHDWLHGHLTHLVNDKQLRHENGAYFVRSYPPKLSAAYKTGETPTLVTGQTTTQLGLW